MSNNPEKVNKVLEELRQRIQDGEYGRSGRLPSRLQLAQEFNTSAETINKAINILKTENFVVTKGRAVAVNPPQFRVNGMMESFARHLRQMGLDPLVEYLGEPERIRLSHGDAQTFGLTEGIEVVRRARRQGTKAQPYRLLESFYPWELVGEEFLQRMKDDPEFVVTEAIKAKTRLFHDKVHERVITRYPTKQERDLLNLLSQSPVLEITRIGRSDSGVVTMFSRIVWNGALCELAYDYSTRDTERKIPS